METGTQTTSCACRPSIHEGPRCQQLEIAFTQPGFAWTSGLGNCARLHLQFWFTSLQTTWPVLLVYAGPANSPDASGSQGDFLAIEWTAQNELTVTVDLGGGPVSLKPSLGSTGNFNDGMWHRVDVMLVPETVNRHKLMPISSTHSEYISKLPIDPEEGRYTP
ncbi:unnamed protein product [Protopolystoma xenopodis]|uniref:Laminin G domain-containing protein n=1 Tax=Protopolystoma xenopodis TaxID=117903 RepID=A0A448WBX8_9PLAT|nr:unnamed protein product [Protopolystoma xenopodis]